MICTRLVCAVFLIGGLLPLSIISAKSITGEVYMQKEERTLSIIKPDAVKENHIGAIVKRFEDKGLKIVASKMIQLSEDQAKAFYAVHKDRPFYNDLVKFMTSGPVVVQVLEGPDAVIRNRDIMGATNPKEAAAGTVRADFANSIEANAVHGSDSSKNAAIEIAFFFDKHHIYTH